MPDLITNVVLRDDESPLQTAVDEHDKVDLEIQPSVADERTITPCLRAYGPPESIDAVRSSFDPEPTIASHQRLDGNDEDDRRLYRMEWTDRSILSRLAAHGGSVLSATLDTDGWDVQLLFPSRADLSAAYTAWKTSQWTVYLKRVRPCNDERATFHGLTDEQHQALKRAIETGYYQVPRRITLAELAADLDISHQALSERLRRANRNLITTVSGFDDPEKKPPETVNPAFDE